MLAVLGNAISRGGVETIYSIWKISLCSSLHFLVKQTVHDSWESVLTNTKKRYDVSLDLKDLVTKYETIRVREDFLRAMATGNFRALIEEAKRPVCYASCRSVRFRRPLHVTHRRRR